MALQRIDDIQLYMGITAEAADCFTAKQILKDNNIPFETFMYTDDSAHEPLFTGLSSWKMEGAPEKMEKFPFVIYVEVHDDLSPSKYPKKCLYGVTSINSIIDLYKLGR